MVYPIPAIHGMFPPNCIGVDPVRIDMAPCSIRDLPNTLQQCPTYPMVRLQHQQNGMYTEDFRFHEATKKRLIYYWNLFQIINLLLIILSLCSIGYAVYQSNNDGIEMYKSDVYIVTPAILAVTFVSVLIMQSSNHPKDFLLCLFFFACSCRYWLWPSR